MKTITRKEALERILLAVNQLSDRELVDLGRNLELGGELDRAKNFDTGEYELLFDEDTPEDDDWSDWGNDPTDDLFFTEAD